MADFETAYSKIRELEGGFVNHPSDPGGATNYGISLRFLQSLGDSDGDGYLDGDLDQDGDIDVHDVANMTPVEAKQKYFDQFWNRYGYAKILDQGIAGQVFALSVHSGPGRAHRLLQEAIAYHEQIVVDGIIGPQTRKLVNTIDPVRIRVELKHETAKFYRALVVADPELGAFLKGWLRRAYND